MQAHGFTTLFVLFKWDLQAAMKDYPEDQALLSRLQKFFGKNSLSWQIFLAKTLTVFKSSWLRNNLSKESSEGEERGGGQASGRETQETSTRGGGIRQRQRQRQRATRGDEIKNLVVPEMFSL